MTPLWFWLDRYGMTPELCVMIGLLAACSFNFRVGNKA